MEKKQLLFVFFWGKERFGHFVVAQCLCFDLWPDIFEESCFCLIRNHGESSPDVEIMGGCLYSQENAMAYW